MFEDLMFQLQLHAIEVATNLSQMTPEHKHAFLQHIYDEYSAIDDEFSVIFDMLMDAMYRPNVEKALAAVIGEFRCQEDLSKAEMLLNNILMYMNDE